MKLKFLVLFLCAIGCSANAAVGAATGDAEYTDESGFKAIKFDSINSSHRAWAQIIDKDAGSEELFYRPCLLNDFMPREKLENAGYSGFLYSRENPFAEYLVFQDSVLLGCFQLGTPVGYFEDAKMQEAIDILGLYDEYIPPVQQEGASVLKNDIPRLSEETVRYLDSCRASAMDAEVFAKKFHYSSEFARYILKEHRGKGLAKIMGGLLNRIAMSLVGKQFMLPYFNPETKRFIDQLSPPCTGLRASITLELLPSIGSHLVADNTIILKRRTVEEHSSLSWGVVFPKDHSVFDHREIVRKVISMEKGLHNSPGGIVQASEPITAKPEK